MFGLIKVQIILCSVGKRYTPCIAGIKMHKLIILIYKIECNEECIEMNCILHYFYNKLTS